jgi:hypothetical protein
VIAPDDRTRVTPDERSRPAGAVTPRQPRQGQPRREPEPEPEHSPVRNRRIAAAAIAAVLVAVVVVVIVLSLQSNATVVLLHPDHFSKNFQDALQQLTDLINSNTS